MAGLLNLVPRYLPRYGMAPEWARATRPLVVIFTGITVLVTIIFDADVDAQGGAYATGVLVLMSSAALAVALTAWRQRRHWVPFGLITLVFIYTTVVNIIERPEGIKIASFFILTIIVHVAGVADAALDRAARPRLPARRDRVAIHRRLGAARRGRPDHRQPSPLRTPRGVRETSCARRPTRTGCRPTIRCCFSKFARATPRSSARSWTSQGVQVGRHRILRCVSPAIPNAIAALLLYIRDQTGQIPHVYFGWTEGNPITYLLRFLAFGEGDTAPVTREVLRQSEHDPARRPRVHVG